MDHILRNQGLYIAGYGSRPESLSSEHVRRIAFLDRDTFDGVDRVKVSFCNPRPRPLSLLFFLAPQPPDFRIQHQLILFQEHVSSSIKQFHCESAFSVPTCIWFPKRFHEDDNLHQSSMNLTDSVTH